MRNSERQIYINDSFAPNHATAIQYKEVIEKLFSVHASMNDKKSIRKQDRSMVRSR